MEEIVVASLPRAWFGVFAQLLVEVGKRVSKGASVRQASSGVLGGPPVDSLLHFFFWKRLRDKRRLRATVATDGVFFCATKLYILANPLWLMLAFSYAASTWR